MLADVELKDGRSLSYLINDENDVEVIGSCLRISYQGYSIANLDILDDGIYTEELRDVKNFETSQVETVIP